MITRWFGRWAAGVVTARNAIMAFGIATAIVSWGPDAVSAQSGSRYKAPPTQAPKWPPARLPDGQPDVQGIWDQVDGTTHSLTDPRNSSSREGDDPLPGTPEYNAREHSPSRVVDPPDGQIPYQPWSFALRRAQGAVWDRPEKPGDFDTMHRCMLQPPRLYYFVRGYRITQTPKHVLMTWDSGMHNYRNIPLDGRPHVGKNIKMWMGDPRGRWEGTTLVVETTNFNAKARLTTRGDFITPNARMLERFIFNDATHMTYEATIDDPTVFTRPWTIRVPQIRRGTDDEMWEEACHEGELGVLLEEKEGTLPTSR